MIISTEINQQIEYFIDDRLHARIGAIAFVHNDDRFETKFKRLRKHEARLRHRTFHRINEQEATVSHAQHALNFATEIGVAWSIENIDAIHLAAMLAFTDGVGDGAVLRENGDAALAFERVGIHDADVTACAKFNDA